MVLAHVWPPGSLPPASWMVPVGLWENPVHCMTLTQHTNAPCDPAAARTGMKRHLPVDKLWPNYCSRSPFAECCHTEVFLSVKGLGICSF